MPVLGCGIDLLDVNRINKYVHPQQFDFPSKEQVFTTYELAQFSNPPVINFFALAFSCKEAAFKAFGWSWNTHPTLWTDVELTITPDNLCSVQLYGSLYQQGLSIGLKHIHTEVLYPKNELLLFKLLLHS